MNELELHKAFGSTRSLKVRAWLEGASADDILKLAEMVTPAELKAIGRDLVREGYGDRPKEHLEAEATKRVDAMIEGCIETFKERSKPHFFSRVGLLSISVLSLFLWLLIYKAFF